MITRLIRWWRGQRAVRLPNRVLRTGTVRDLERLEHSYQQVGLEHMVRLLREKTGGDYAYYVLRRDSDSWQN